MPTALEQAQAISSALKARMTLPKDDPLSMLDAGEIADDVRRRQAMQQRSQQRVELGAPPQSHMAVEDVAARMPTTMNEIAAGKRAAQDWQKRRDAEKSVGASLAYRKGTTRPTTLPTPGVTVVNPQKK